MWTSWREAKVAEEEGIWLVRKVHDCRRRDIDSQEMVHGWENDRVGGEQVEEERSKHIG